MTLREAKAQYALGLISTFKFSTILLEVITTTTDQDEIIEIFWAIIDWEEDLKTQEINIKTTTATECHFNACNAFRANRHAPAYLRKIIQPLAKYRPLPKRLEKIYPRPQKNDTE